jgi:alpha-1,3-rhamnosyl/mannosyltransferase
MLAAKQREGASLAIRVAVNQLAALGLRTGVGYYAAQLVRHLKTQAGDDRVEAFPRGLVKQIRRLGARLQSGSAHGPGNGQPPGRSLASSALRQLKPYLLRGYDFILRRHTRRWLTRDHYDLYHEPNFLTLPCELPTIVTLHDLSVFLHPQWHPADRVARHQRQFHRTLGQAAHFLTDTEFIRQEVIQTLNIPPERVTRAYLGIRPSFRPLPVEQVAQTLQQLGLPRRFLLYVGTIEPRKNVLRLMRAYCSLEKTVREQWPLLLVGSWGWKTEAVADFYEREGKHQGIRQLGYLPDQHLAAVYNGARALIFPSYYEGFGLPPLEMMACGGAVLASTAGALVEMVGTRAHLVDAEDDDGWRLAMARVVQDDDWWYSLRRGVTEVARPYTWQRCAVETLQAYRRACSVVGPEGSTLSRAA